MNKNPLYLIPFDFSPVSESAVRIGLDLAISNKGSVLLLHVVKNQHERLEAKLKFKDYLSSLSDVDRKLTVSKAIIGDIYEDISKAGDLLDASLIVMGTHGARGFQKVFGSHAVKMISYSDQPFLITQGKKSVDKMKVIVMPFSFQKKSIQIATFASTIAKKFNATIHLVGYHDSDELLEKGTQVNQKIVRDFLTEKGVNYEVVTFDKNARFEKELMSYAAKVDADLMAAGYYKEGIITNPNSFIQAMIENELNIPLLTVNAEGLTNASGASAASGY